MKIRFAERRTPDAERYFHADQDIPWESRSPLGLWVVMISALLLFTAPLLFSLPSLDDCFYARKGIEMERSGNFFTVTWNGAPTFQNPPLQFWLLGRSFRIFGENDVAARLPSVLMALSVLLGTYQIARMIFGKACGLLSAALLTLTPFFYSHAQRCMLEMPLAFWATLSMLLFLKGLKSPRWHLWLAPALAGAILTKSLLGLLPLFIIGGVGLYNKEIRRAWSSPYLQWGIALGLLFGASWTIHQALTLGREALEEHYFTEIFQRSVNTPLTVGRWLTAYLFDHSFWGSFQPLIIPAFAGLIFSVFQRIKGRRSPEDLLAVWMILPVFLYSFSATSTDRYIYPILTPAAILAARVIGKISPAFSRILIYGFVPSFSLVFAAVVWFCPVWVADHAGGFLRWPDDGNRVFKEARPVAKILSPKNHTVLYRGEGKGNYWEAANPFLYYWDLYLLPSGEWSRETVPAATADGPAFLVCPPESFAEINKTGPPWKILARGKTWYFLQRSPLPPSS
jgi:4-amino-4-deoxy-L-arabinose transferase-like glycosyltransferase